MVKTTEISSIITDIQNYQAAYVNFVTRYKELPGDMQDGSFYWPTTCTSTPSISCNGNGDGFIANIPSSSQQESTLAWRHLSLAGMISGIAPYDNSAAVAGVNAPASKVNGASYIIASGNCSITGTWNNNNPLNLTSLTRCGLWNDNSTIGIMIGKSSNTIQNHGALTPNQALNIDQKLDDGHVDPATGNVIGAKSGTIRVVQGVDYTNDDCLIGSPNMAYAMSSKEPSCILASAIPAY